MAPARTLPSSFPGLRRILHHVWPYVRRQRWLLAGSLLALVVEVGIRALEPWPLKFIFDLLLGGRHSHRWTALQSLEPTTILTLSALALVVLTGMRALAAYLCTISFARIANRALGEMRLEVFRHVHRLSLSFHTRARSGDLILRVLSDVNLLKDVAVTAALPLLANLLVLSGMVGMMFWLHWKLTLLALAALPFFWLWTSRLTRRIHHAARSQRQRESNLAASAAESILAIKVVQALSLENLFASVFGRRNRESQREDVKTQRLTAALERTVAFFTATATALVLWYGTRLVLTGALTPGDLVVFLTYLKATFKPVQDFAKYTGRLAKATAAGERVLDLLDRPPEVRDLPGAVAAPPLRGEIRFEQVTFAYEPGCPVFDRLDLTIEAGRFVALVGPSGTGKSTLVNLLLRLYDPARGQVLIDGRDVREYTLDSLRSQISVVLQETQLFAVSVAENIACGAQGADRRAVEAAARLANAHDFIEALPHGYATVLGERGATLSGGQRQRIAIARAAVRHAPLLILDEPAAGLDEENQRVVFETLDRLARGRTTLLITHDLLWASRADLILYLEDGCVLERGGHAELMQLDGRYAGLFRAQAASLNESSSV